MEKQGLIPAKQHFAAIALLALSMISIQILITRIFSVVFYYHFAFAGVTLAMLGLTIGAFRVYYTPARFRPQNVDKECGKHALKAAILLVIATLLMVDVSGRVIALSVNYDGNIREALKGFGGFLLLFAPFPLCFSFISMGVCVTLLLTYFPSYTNKLYATDLVSAALGCVFTILMLKFMDPVSIILLLSSLLAFLGVKLTKNNMPHEKRLYKPVLLVLVAMFAVQSSTYVTGSPFLHLRIGKLSLLKPFDFERWNSFTHVGVFSENVKQPFGDGFGSKLTDKNYGDLEQRKLVIDADAATVLTKFDGDLNKLNYLKYDVVNSAYSLRDVGSAAVIGVGGGRDVLSAMVFGVKNITGIEINPAIFEALNKVFADFTGHLSSYPGVNLVNAEARSYISSHDATYDMIQISMIDTWAATAAGGLALSENKLYTKEAWVEFLNHLNDNGMLSVTRWYMPEKHHGELYRLLSLANAALKETNPDAKISDHLIMQNSGFFVTMVLSKSPFTAAEIKKAEKSAALYGFETFIKPGKDWDDISKTILSGNATPEFYSSLPLDLTTTTDDRPFFFNMARFRNIISAPLGGGYNISNNAAVYVLSVLSAIVFIYLAYALARPMYMLYKTRRSDFTGAAPYAAYFTLIGLGFMFIEMSLMQWLTIYLGHPVYGLSVILFTLLLFSGIGSYTVKYDTLTAKTYITRPLILCVVLTILSGLVYYLRPVLAHNDTSMRITLSVLLLIPASLFLGMMFPLGIAAAKKKHAGLLPWFWALNGAASVFASIFAVVVSMSYGASASYAIGLLCYILCFLICTKIGKTAASI